MVPTYSVIGFEIRSDLIVEGAHKASLNRTSTGAVLPLTRHIVGQERLYQEIKILFLDSFLFERNLCSQFMEGNDLMIYCSRTRNITR